MTLPPASTSSPAVRIGVFDSGVGGLSVLRELRQAIPQAQLHYVADSAHAPYGEKSEDEIIDRSLRLAEHLHQLECDALVVACNTATAAAVRHIRERHTAWKVIGVEPGIKPAAQRSKTGKVGVMATTGTLRSEKFRLLAQAHAAHVELVLQPCPGLAAAIETGSLDSPEVKALVRRHITPLKEAGVDTVVLGCTHYPFVRTHIQAALGPGVDIVDTARAVARHTTRVLGWDPDAALTCDPTRSASKPMLQTTGAPDALATFARQWLDFTCEIDPRPLQA